MSTKSFEKTIWHKEKRERRGENCHAVEEVRNDVNKIL